MICGIPGDVGRGRRERKAAANDLRDWVLENRESRAAGSILGIYFVLHI